MGAIGKHNNKRGRTKVLPPSNVWINHLFIYCFLEEKDSLTIIVTIYVLYVERRMSQLTISSFTVRSPQLFGCSLLESVEFYGVFLAHWVMYLKLGLYFLLRAVVCCFGSSISFVVLWSLRKKRTERIFRNAVSSMRDILKVVLWKVGQWATGRKEFDHFNLDKIIFNREACMVCSFS